MPASSRPPTPHPPSPLGRQPIFLDAILGSEHALFRLVALLHRKGVPVRALLVQPVARPGQGYRLRLAVLPGNAPTAHVIELICGIVGITGVRLAVPAPPSGGASRRCQVFLLNGSAHPIRTLRPARGGRSPFPDLAVGGMPEVVLMDVTQRAGVPEGEPVILGLSGDLAQGSSDACTNSNQTSGCHPGTDGAPAAVDRPRCRS